MRPRPYDFRTTYVDVGKDGAIAHYRAHWKTVDRWVCEEGKEGLRAARAAKVAERRARRAPKPRIVPVAVDRVPPDRFDLHAACSYLRDKVTVVGVNERGEHFVGNRVMLPSAIVQLALDKGMDEGYVERDMFQLLDIENGTDEWVLDRELTR